MITSADAGDVGLYFQTTGWVRVGNIVHGNTARLDQIEAELGRGLKSRTYYLGDDQDTTPYRIYQADGSPGIAEVADLDGDYVLVLKNPSAMISGAIVGNENRIDELRIFITNGGIAQRVHSVDPYTYSSAIQVIPFNISDAEESSVVASITQGYVEFRIAPFLQNGAVGNCPQL